MELEPRNQVDLKDQLPEGRLKTQNVQPFSFAHTTSVGEHFCWLKPCWQSDITAVSFDCFVGFSTYFIIAANVLLYYDAVGVKVLYKPN